MNILITGAAGFIGSNLVAALAATGSKDIVVCDYLGNENKWRNLAKHQVADIVDIFIFCGNLSNSKYFELIYLTI